MGSLPADVEKNRMKLFLIVLVVSACDAGLISGIKEKYESVKSRLQCAEMPNNGTCAILFDDDDCTGWQLAINEGYTELPSRKLSDLFFDGPRKNDAEAVLVRKGCVFIGYDHDKDSSRGLGDAIIVAAVEGHKYQNFDDDDFDELDEEISSVDCVCDGFVFSDKKTRG